MGGAGSSSDPLLSGAVDYSLLGPEGYQQSLEIQRRQMLAQMLMQSQTPKEIAGHPTGPLSYAADAISHMLGAYETGKAFDAQKQMYAGLLNGGQQQSNPSNVPFMAPNGYQAPPAQQPEQPLWLKLRIMKAQGYPDEFINAYAASGGDMNAAKTAEAAKYLPTPPPGSTWIPDANAQSGWSLSQAGGGQDAITSAARSKQVGEEKPEQFTITGADNQPHVVLARPSDIAPILNQGSGIMPPAAAPSTGNLGVDSNNPLNLQPGGKEAKYSNPTAGVLAADRLLQQYGAQGVNTVNAIVKKWAPYAPPDYAAGIAKKMGVDPNKPLNLSDVNVRGAYLEAASPHETGQPLPTAGGNQPAVPANGPHIQTAPEQARVKAQTDVQNALPGVRANTQQLIQEIDDLSKLSAGMPASGGKTLEAANWLDENFPNMSPYGGKLAAAVKGWEQLGSSKALANIQQLAKSGIGRMDIPIVKAVQAASVAPWELTAEGRSKILEQLRAMVLNNQTTLENTARGFSGEAPLPMKSGVSSKPSLQDLYDEARKRGLVK